MVWACAVKTRKFAFCGELNVRFLNPVRPGEPVHAVGEMAENRRNRIFEAKAELRNASGAVLATATGKYLPVRAADAAVMAEDFVGDAGRFLEGGQPAEPGADISV
jgi:acyl-coenzyme A thioesterase PaaI-like protein